MRAAGWDVEVYERIGDDLAGRGAGLGTHDALREMMARVGIDVVTPLGVATHAYVCRDRSGRPMHEIKLARVMSAWARLYRPLRDALPDANYHPGMTLARARLVPPDEGRFSLAAVGLGDWGLEAVHPATRLADLIAHPYDRVGDPNTGRRFNLHCRGRVQQNPLDEDERANFPAHTAPAEGCVASLVQW